MLRGMFDPNDVESITWESVVILVVLVILAAGVTAIIDRIRYKTWNKNW